MTKAGLDSCALELPKLQLVPPIPDSLARDTIALCKGPCAGLGVGDEASIDAAIAFVFNKLFHQVSGHQVRSKLRVVPSHRTRSEDSQL